MFICSRLSVTLLPAAISKITLFTLSEPHADDEETKWCRNSCISGGGKWLSAKRLMKSCSGGSRLTDKSNFNRGMQEMSHSTQGKSEIKSADLSLLIMKPLGAKWMIEAVEDTKL